jgi:hypothetical protein
VSFILFVGGLIGGDVQRLDSPRFETREAAHARLKFCGPFAVPALLDGAKSDSAEVRLRSQALLARWRNVWWNLEAARVLTAKDMPDEFDFYHNHRLRLHTFRMAQRMGLMVWNDEEVFGCSWMSHWDLTPNDLAFALHMLRSQVKAK